MADEELETIRAEAQVDRFLISNLVQCLVMVSRQPRLGDVFMTTLDALAESGDARLTAAARRRRKELEELLEKPSEPE